MFDLDGSEHWSHFSPVRVIFAAMSLIRKSVEAYLTREGLGKLVAFGHEQHDTTARHQDRTGTFSRHWRKWFKTLTNNNNPGVQPIRLDFIETFHLSANHIIDNRNFTGIQPIISYMVETVKLAPIRGYRSGFLYRQFGLH